MKVTFKHTKYACYLGSSTQSIVNTLSPLLFIIFREQLGLSFTQLSLLITVNFALQMFIDFTSAFFIPRLGYRKCIILANAFAMMGLIFTSIFTLVMTDKFLALIISTVLMSVGGGLFEVIVNPIVEALPGDEKASAMSIMHSFYCWGQVAVILGTTLYFLIFGRESWIALPMLWALVPTFGAIIFVFVPINSLPADENTGGSRLLALAKTKSFWLMLILMICAGASELSMSQWASLFAEVGLGVSKTAGDLLGPCSFALCMAIGRFLFGKLASGLKIENWLTAAFSLSALGFIIAAISPIPLISLAGFAICGFGVSILWPGICSLGAQKLHLGGSLMFSLFALAGDVGCTVGPDIIGLISDNYSGGFLDFLVGTDPVSSGLRMGLLTAALFPLAAVFVSIVLSFVLRKTENK